MAKSCGGRGRGEITDSAKLFCCSRDVMEGSGSQRGREDDSTGSCEVTYDNLSEAYNLWHIHDLTSLSCETIFPKVSFHPVQKRRCHEQVASLLAALCDGRTALQNERFASKGGESRRHALKLRNGMGRGSVNRGGECHSVHSNDPLQLLIPSTYFLFNSTIGCIG